MKLCPLVQFSCNCHYVTCFRTMNGKGLLINCSKMDSICLFRNGPFINPKIALLSFKICVLDFYDLLHESTGFILVRENLEQGKRRVFLKKSLKTWKRRLKEKLESQGEVNLGYTVYLFSFRVLIYNFCNFPYYFSAIFSPQFQEIDCTSFTLSKMNLAED